MDFLGLIREAGRKKIIYTFHATEEMNTEKVMISTAEVRQVIYRGRIIEDYPEDKRGHSALLLGWPETGRPIHVVCAPREDFLAIVTAYVPSLDKWENDFKTRRQR